MIRNAAHVIQLNCNGRNPPHSRQPSIAFQEFTPEFNHLPYTLGIAGRPGGPDFYFNLVSERMSKSDQITIRCTILAEDIYGGVDGLT